MFDHLVLAVPDLATARGWFAELTGVEPAPGGRHVGLGTANALVGLGAERYLEIVGPDPDGPEPGRPRPFGIDELTEPRLVTWALRSRDLDADLAAARAAGHDPGPAREMSRRTPTGELPRWRLTLGADGRDTGVVPFVIDWLDAPHPTTTALPGVGLLSFEVIAADPDAVRAALSALGSDVAVVAGIRDALVATVAGRDGRTTTLR